MYVTRTQVSTPCGSAAAAIDAKDYASAGLHMVTNCGVGASDPKAIYIRPFCIDAAVFEGDEAASDGEMPIRKALTPVEFAQDLKEELEKIAPARILKDHESPRLGWLVDGHFDRVDGGSPLARFFFGNLGAGRSFLAVITFSAREPRHETLLHSGKARSPRRHSLVPDTHARTGRQFPPVADR